MRFIFQVLWTYALMAVAYQQWWVFPEIEDADWKEKVLVWAFLYPINCIFFYVIKVRDNDRTDN